MLWIVRILNFYAVKNLRTRNRIGKLVTNWFKILNINSTFQLLLFLLIKYQDWSCILTVIFQLSQCRINQNCSILTSWRKIVAISKAGVSSLITRWCIAYHFLAFVRILNYYIKNEVLKVLLIYLSNNFYDNVWLRFKLLRNIF